MYLLLLLYAENSSPHSEIDTSMTLQLTFLIFLLCVCACLCMYSCKWELLCEYTRGRPENSLGCHYSGYIHLCFFDWLVGFGYSITHWTYHVCSTSWTMSSRDTPASTSQCWKYYNCLLSWPVLNICSGDKTWVYWMSYLLRSILHYIFQ